ncbi:uncharacterized protein LOC133523300 isoform X2 [Cydia pomonella]|uniref:uncharacterized protein LOC133523300 isoform X2 n=1 Tax=Cydia pomonella TaxID=82600 RepID=UPI002ADD4DE8|nr:uncharacterized protein LOC133523300 isoform X2 [Cydia pomonella]
MQTVLVIFLLFSLSVLGYPDSNQNINTIDEEHQKIVEDLQQRSVQCAKEKQKLGAQIKALKKLLKDKNTTLEDTLEIIESCKKRNVHYLTTNQEAVQKLEECSSEKEAQDRALEAQNYDIKEKERKIAECEQKNKIIQNNNDELDSIAAELENDIERAQSKATDIRSKLKQPSSVRMG